MKTSNKDTIVKSAQKEKPNKKTLSNKKDFVENNDENDLFLMDRN